MNKLIEGALDIVGGTEIGEQVTKLKDNVLETVGVQTETKEALQEASLDQVATTYEALASKVGIADQKETITKFIVKGKGEDEFTEIHNTIKTLAQKGGADVSKLDEVLTTHKLTGGSKIGFTIANALGGFVRKTLEKLNFIHSSKDLGKMVFAINEITTKLDMSKLDSTGENSTNGESKSPESLKDWDGTVEGLKGKLIWPLKGDDLYVTTEHGEFGDDRGNYKHRGIDIGGESDDIIASYDMKITEIAYQEGGAGRYIKGQVEPPVYPNIEFKIFHLSDTLDTKVGQVFKKGEIIAKEGSTGHSSGEHAHFELWIGGKEQDPLKAFDPHTLLYVQGGKKVEFDEREHADDYRQAA